MQKWETPGTFILNLVYVALFVVLVAALALVAI